MFKLTKQTPNIHYSKPWWNNACANSIKLKHKARNLFRRHPTEENYFDYKNKESSAKKCILNAKRCSFREYITSINSQTSTKEVWGKVGALSGKYAPYKPTLLTDSDGPVTCPTDKSKLIADFFEKSFCCRMFPHNNKYLITVAMFLSDDRYKAYNMSFTHSELDYAISTSKSSAPGHDLVHNL